MLLYFGCRLLPYYEEEVIFKGKKAHNMILVWSPQ